MLNLIATIFHTWLNIFTYVVRFTTQSSQSDISPHDLSLSLEQFAKVLVSCQKIL
jgi:hypothetical protein